MARIIAEVEPHVAAWMMANPSLPVPEEIEVIFRQANLFPKSQPADPPRPVIESPTPAS